MYVRRTLTHHITKFITEKTRYYLLYPINQPKNPYDNSNKSSGSDWQRGGPRKKDQRYCRLCGASGRSLPKACNLTLPRVKLNGGILLEECDLDGFVFLCLYVDCVRLRGQMT